MAEPEELLEYALDHLRGQAYRPFIHVNKSGRVIVYQATGPERDGDFDLAAALRAALAARPQLVQVGWYTPRMADGPNVGSLLDGRYNDDDEPVYRIEAAAGSETPTDDERDARFATGNDAIWGEGNWIRCPTCPRDHEGRGVYHHKDAHSTTPTGDDDE